MWISQFGYATYRDLRRPFCLVAVKVTEGGSMVRIASWTLLFLVGWPQDTQQNVGTKLTWHYTSGTFAGGEVTTYTMGDRRRTEYRNTSNNRQPDGSFAIGDPPGNVVVQRCDLGRSFGLNTKAQEYSQKDYPPKPLALIDSDRDTSTLPAIRAETTTVDTGERKEIFGQTARHVITTTKSTLTSDTKSEQSVSVKDGWYIDYDPRISCEPVVETKLNSFGWIMFGGGLMKTSRAENIFVGQPERGLFVEGSKNSGTAAIKGSNGVNVILSNGVQVTEFYRGPVDPSLFDVPTGFRPCGCVLYQDPWILP
jgi:hypothetical protein